MGNNWDVNLGVLKIKFRDGVPDSEKRGAKIGAIIAAAALLAVPFILALHMLGAI